MTLLMRDQENIDKGREQGLEEGRKEGRQEERKNTDYEKKRADKAEEQVKKLRELLEKNGISLKE